MFSGFTRFYQVFLRGLARFCQWMSVVLLSFTRYFSGFHGICSSFTGVAALKFSRQGDHERAGSRRSFPMVLRTHLTSLARFVGLWVCSWVFLCKSCQHVFSVYL